MFTLFNYVIVALTFQDIFWISDVLEWSDTGRFFFALSLALLLWCDAGLYEQRKELKELRRKK